MVGSLSVCLALGLLCGLLFAPASGGQDGLADLLSGVLDFLHGLTGAGARGLVSTLGFANIVLCGGHKLLESVKCVHGDPLVYLPSGNGLAEVLTSPLILASGSEVHETPLTGP
jgi:hypothetical protein